MRFKKGNRWSKNGKGKLRLDMDEQDKNNIFDNFNEVIEVGEIENGTQEISSDI